MKYFFCKMRLVVCFAVCTFFVVVAMAAPQAWANGADDAATRALEQKVRELEDQLNAIRNELGRVKSDSVQEAQHVKEIEEEVATIKKVQKSKHHMLFFRGGFTHAMEKRPGTSLASDVVPVGAQDTADQNGWYVGAGFDFSLTDDLWGLLPRTQVMSELMFEYKHFSSNTQGNALANTPSQLAGGALNPRDVTVSQFTLTASPKIKFLEGSKFRPWIIPAGLAFHVISPPSESISFFNPGVMFGAGADYNIWEDFYIGIDGRYHLTAGEMDGIDFDGMTAGGYVGIGF